MENSASDALSRLPEAAAKCKYATLISGIQPQWLQEVDHIPLLQNAFPPYQVVAK